MEGRQLGHRASCQGLKDGLTLLSLALVIALLSGCGGGSTIAASSTRSTTSSNGESRIREITGRGAEFRVPGRPGREVDQILTGSREASAAERDAASAVLERSLEARESHDWSGQCRTLDSELTKVVQANSSTVAGVLVSCATGLRRAGEKVPPTALENTMRGSIGALRLIGGRQAFAFYHGLGGKDYLIPMAKEGDEWKVAALTAEEIPG